MQNGIFNRRKQTFVDVPHDSSVVDRPGDHGVSILSPANVINILYVSSEHMANNLCSNRPILCFAAIKHSLLCAILILSK